MVANTEDSDLHEAPIKLEKGMYDSGPQLYQENHFKTEEPDHNHTTQYRGDGMRYRGKPEQVGAACASDRGEAFLDVLLEGMTEGLDTEVSMDTIPTWVDLDLLRKGREFTTKYLFGVIFSHIPALAMVFTFQPGLEPIIFTGKSDTPFKAFRRYLSTVASFISWYETDMIDKDSEGYKSMGAVRMMHASIYKKINEASEEEVRTKTTVQGRKTGVWSTYLEDLKKDFLALDVDASKCPFARIAAQSKEYGKFLYVNQLDLAYTQLGFVAFVILYPQYFGVHGATEEQLEAYCHLWRYLGHLLGIKDRYNICSEKGLEDTRDRCRAVIEKWVKPGFREVTPDWEHMYRCLLEGLNHHGNGNTFGGSVSYLMWVLDIPVPNLRAKMTWFETFMFYFHCFMMCFLTRIPGVMMILNHMVHRSIEWAKKASPEWLRKKKEIVYDYEKGSMGKI
ncbi:uncharacterized protein LOC124162071 [Ischnura elegans]|uniref:uncharacterized protein LOC124162071 n=1 Tax=Ischnura elegans TaxID=197161 RepID=UPI001ED8AACE|nr:uncharacterized protein LOC124162071 [Ischnura elegans]